MTTSTAREPHPLRHQTVELNQTAQDPQRHIVEPGAKFQIDDWYVNMDPGAVEPLLVVRNWAEMWYLRRAASTGLPLHDLVYGHIGNLGHLVHASELGEEVTA